MWLFDVRLIESVFMVCHSWTEMRDVITVSEVSSCPFSMMSGSPFSVVSSSPFSVVSGSPFSMVTVSFVMGISPVFGMVRSFVMAFSPEGVMDWFETWVDVSSSGFVSLFKSMSFGSSMSEMCIVELNVTSVLCEFV